MTRRGSSRGTTRYTSMIQKDAYKLINTMYQIKLREWVQGQRTGVDLRVNEDPADPRQRFGEFKNGTWYKKKGSRPPQRHLDPDS